ncbi:RNA methyltransferase [Comamonas denitrificans]|jgi:RNA methyltransferase, TrmH family|uniref:RNA methyltransferase n=1 Tax=Comamonas denitrificans TaxID=117506 RepID=A0A939GZM6_9BURK|nr:RNA methyltransferase [Comamonas denitrificans]MBO1248921.1 RNA methyltransferase [Comamonas denitrificans]MBP9973208.1 RNA methyltransferase [Comamonas sp.]MCZ2107462.1 RNA methyltransferase [Burkholderiales bacterium]HRM65807.1 RNA methyltransferase [Comamonas denitrificans]
MKIITITSRDNGFIKDLKRLAREASAYRRLGYVWLEGDHLCRAALTRGLRADTAVFSDSYWSETSKEWAQTASKVVILPDALFAEISALESPAKMGFILPWQGAATQLQPGVATLVLDRVQDAGNVGAMLRSASAFGFAQVLALKGTAALWSQKVLRAGMGAHFGLHLVESASAADIAQLNVPLLATSSHQGAFLHQADLPWPCAWAMGHEGQGVGPEVASQAQLWVRIAQPGGEESLNVAAAAAICLHASALQACKQVG